MKVFQNDKIHPGQIKRFGLGMALFWIFVVALSLTWNIIQIREHVVEEANIRAQSVFEKDITYRRWNASHGGVYVPVTEETQPNPYLADDPKRDIVTLTGETLTLINPAYMTRQVHEIEAQGDSIFGHITSLNPIRPQNKPDPWETEALKRIDAGKSTVTSIEEVNGEEYLRFMGPLFVEEGCLKCHARQGYELGDIRGGISVSIPIEPLWADVQNHIFTIALGYSFLGVLGLVGISIGANRLVEGQQAREKIEEDLRVSRDEVEERRQAEEALRASEEKYKLLFDSAGDAIFVHDDNMRILAVNSQVLNRYGYTRKELMSMSVAEIDTPEELPNIPERHGQLKEQGFLIFETRHQRQDGSHIFVDVNARPIMWGKTPAIMSICRDITERKEAETTLQRRADEFSVLYETASEIAGQTELTELINTVTTRSAALLGVSGGGLYLYDAGQNALEVVASTHPAIPLGTILQVGEGMAGQVAQSRQPLVVGNYRKWEHRAEQYSAVAFKAVAEAPMLYRGSLIGVLAAFEIDDDTRRFSEDDVRLLSLLASGVAGVIQNARDITERKRAEEALIQAKEFAENLIQTANVIFVHLNVQGEVIQLNQAAEEITGYALSELVGQNWFETLVPKERYPYVWEEFSNIMDQGTFPKKYENPILTKSGEERYIVWQNSMLYQADEIIGTISFGIDITERRQIEERERSQRMLAEALQKAAKILNSSLDLDETLAKILDIVGDVVRFDRASVVWVDEPKAQYIKFLGFESSEEKRLKTQPFKMDDFPSYQKIIESRKSLVISSTKTDTRWVSLSKNEWIRSYIGIPVVVEKCVVAIINLDSKEPGFYTAEDAKNLEAFANQVAVAVQNAIFFEEVQNLATIDDLTTLYNRRGFFEVCRREVGRLQRYGRSFSVLFVDIDHFKQFNDRYSYEVGDQVLRQVAETLHDNAREIDVVGRYGGEEMVILLPEIDQVDAVETAERLRIAIENLRVLSDQGLLGVTVSIGIATLIPVQGQTIPMGAELQAKILDELISKAGQALHIAKKRGRNQVMAYIEGD